MAKKFDGDYLQIVDVSSDSVQMRVSFANGDRIDISTTELAPARLRATIHWANARPSAAGTSVLVPADPADLEIPSTRIRRLSDKKFATHVARLAEDQAKLIGSRLKSLRERRGLTQKQVAQSAHLEPSNLSRIESGRFDVSSTTLWKILAAMDCSIADLAAPQSTQEQEEGHATPARV